MQGRREVQGTAVNVAFQIPIFASAQNVCMQTSRTFAPALAGLHRLHRPTCKCKTKNMDEAPPPVLEQSRCADGLDEPSGLYDIDAKSPKRAGDMGAYATAAAARLDSVAPGRPALRLAAGLFAA